MTSHFPLVTRPTQPVDLPEARYKGFAPGSSVLPKGFRYERGAKALPCAVVRDRDVALTMRDGVTVYADVYRPQTADPVPAIVNLSPYGKGDTGFWHLGNKAMFPNRFGIKKGRLSGLQVWEGCDPAFWCAHGYAVVQVDARGAFNSEGDINYLSSAEARDGHDIIEEIARLPWSSGKVGMAGNSWLTMIQWRTAAEQPPHLAAIAPWEGLTDLYREVLCRGGVPRTAFPAFVRDKMYGKGSVEDPIAMLVDHPLYDEYWQDKQPDVARITAPAYVVASYSNPIHVGGTLRNWAQLTGDTWLRIHNSHEWPDFYDPANERELLRFFDRYLKDQDNGWESTPRVRISVLDPGHQDTVNRAEDSFPPSRVQPVELYLHADGTSMDTTLRDSSSTTSYEIRAEEPHVDFTYRFQDDVEVIGSPVLTVFVSVEGASDGDLHVTLQKLDAKGRQVWHQAVTLGIPLARHVMPIAHKRGVEQVGLAFYSGAHGVLRLSRRGLEDETVPGFPQLSLREERPLEAGEVVEAQVPLWPTAMRWHAGEYVRVRVSGRRLQPSVLPGLVEEPLQPGQRHLLHTDGDFPSRLLLPVASGTV